MVGHRWPVALDVVAAGREVVADAIGHLAEAVVGEQPVQAGQRPVRLARCSTSSGCRRRASIGPRRRSGRSPRRRAASSTTMNRPSARISSSSRVSPVSRRRSTRPSGQERRTTDRRRRAVGERGPAVVVDEAIASPVDAAVGALQRAVDPGRRRLVQAHHAAGVAHQVVGLAGDLAVGRPVVLVQPRAVAALVVARTTARRRRRAESSDSTVGCGQRSGGARAPKATTAATTRPAAGEQHPAARRRGSCGAPAAGHRARAASAARTTPSRQAAGDEAAGPAGDRRYRRGRRRSAAIRPARLDAEPGQPVEAGGRTTATRRWARVVGSIASTRSRVDGTAQITSAATARYENTSTSADSWMATWKQMATQIAA